MEEVQIVNKNQILRGCEQGLVHRSGETNTYGGMKEHCINQFIHLVVKSPTESDTRRSHTSQRPAQEV